MRCVKYKTERTHIHATGGGRGYVEKTYMLVAEDSESQSFYLVVHKRAQRPVLHIQFHAFINIHERATEVKLLCHPVVFAIYLQFIIHKLFSIKLLKDKNLKSAACKVV